MNSATPHVIEGRYLKDILDQPRAVASTLEHLETTLDRRQLQELLQAPQINRIVLTGMGSSMHALYPLQLLLNAHGMTAFVVETSELIHYMPDVLSESSIVVAVSQSGQSIELVRMLDLNQGRARVVGVTNTADSPLALRSDVTLLTVSGEEFSVSAKTYVSALVALEVLGAIWCGLDLQSVFSELHVASRLLEEYLSGWRDHVTELSELFEQSTHIFLAGRGLSLAAVATGALIAKESTRMHVEGMSSAAFRHGPMEMVSPRTTVIVFEGDEPTRELNLKLVSDVEHFSGRAYLIGPSTPIQALRIAPDLHRALPLFEILPIQMLTLALAANSGFEAGRFERATKITTEE